MQGIERMIEIHPIIENSILFIIDNRCLSVQLGIFSGCKRELSYLTFDVIQKMSNTFKAKNNLAHRKDRPFLNKYTTLCKKSYTRLCYTILCNRGVMGG